MKMLSIKNVISISILFVGILAFVGVVVADTTSTSVTVGNATPTITNLSLNGGNDINLIENSFVFASTTMTITDSNGCDTISSVTAKVYRGATNNAGTVCMADDNNCYVEFYTCMATSTDTCTGGADTTVDYECAFKLWYIADPTSTGSAFDSDIWSVSATTSDGVATASATNTAETIEINELLSLDVSTTIVYGSLSPGTNTDTSNQTVTVTNTGNASLDTEISGDDMCTDYDTCAGSILAATQQKYGFSNVAYGSLSFGLTNTPTSRVADLAKPTATTTAITDDTFWGIEIPGGQANGSYTGLNTFTAVGD
jgi:hypothetical protein